MLITAAPAFTAQLRRERMLCKIRCRQTLDKKNLTCYNNGNFILKNAFEQKE